MRKLGPRKFYEKFHREAVRLASDPKRLVKELSVELGVSVTTLRNWLRTVSLEKPASTGRVLSLEEQVRRLSKENERLHEEREILKKATAFFTTERGDEIRLHPDAHLHLARCAGH
jgi:transposase